MKPLWIVTGTVKVNEGFFAHRFTHIVFGGDEDEAKIEFRAYWEENGGNDIHIESVTPALGNPDEHSG